MVGATVEIGGGVGGVRRVFCFCKKRENMKEEREESFFPVEVDGSKLELKLKSA